MTSICGQCKHLFGKSCCEISRGDVPTMPLSLPEVKRIADHTKKSMKDFIVVDQVTKAEVEDFAAIAPVFKSMMAGNARLRLKVVDDPDDAQNSMCIFLEKGKGCSLPKSVRPHGCRLYPFDYSSRLAKSDAGGVILTQPKEHCLAHVASDSDPGTLMVLLRTSATELAQVGIIREKDAQRHAEILREE